MTCELCNGTGWVCENRPTEPWEKPNGETCCGAGMPCVCNPSAEYEFGIVYASAAPEKVKEWAQ